ncbi:MAG: hypothetical protein KDC93_07125 [Cyclobacteriaceae bacterium]|nr:hypothetical protein [Cyclobacteriaceae bacterium]
MNFFRVIINLFHFNRTNWKAVTLCLLTALVFWFFNALNKDYSTNLRFAVNFQFDQERYVPVEPLPKAVFMNVSGNGWDLLRKSLGVNLPDMNISLERPTEVKKIVGSTLPALLAGQLGNLQINHVVTDTLYLSLDPREKRRIKVAVDPANFAFASGFGRLSPIVVLPDSISLEGPKSVLDQLPDSVLLELNEEEIKSDFREEVEVKVWREDLLKRTPESVEVIFEVVEWIDVNKTVRLVVENVPGNARLNLVKDSVQCLIQVPRNQLEDFNEAMGQQVAVLDLKGVKKGEKRLLPRIQGLPVNTRLIQVDSVSVKLY